MTDKPLENDLTRRNVLQKGAATGALVIGGTAVVATQSVAASQKPEIIRDDLTGDVIECGETTLTLTQGTFQVVFHDVEDNSGGIHLIAEGNAKSAKAVDEDGNIYAVNGGFWAELNSKDDNATFTVTETFHALGRGDVEDFKFEAVTHFTVVDGDIVVEFMKGGGDCVP